MSRRAAILLILFISAYVGAFPSTATITQQSWTGQATLVAGTSRYDAGEWIHTDFVYDDYGADTTPSGQPNVVSLAPTAGDFRYPAGHENAADIVEVRAQISDTIASDLEVRVLLQTITDAKMIALQAEVNGSTLIVTHLNSVIDEESNTVSFAVPGAASGDDVTLNIGAGLHDGEGGLKAGVPGSARVFTNEITTGGPSNNRLFDLAFNTHTLEGRGGAWNEDVQARRLQEGNLTPFRQTIDLDLLRSGESTPIPVESGYFVRLFQSRQELGEGMASSFPQYLGKWQPYAIWVPTEYSPGVAVPLFLNMHSLSVHHNQYRGGPLASASYKTFYEQFDTGLGAVVVTPLARGPDGWYQDEALVDTLEVWADALKNYTIDPEKIYVGGYSMGGYGTYRLSTLMPDTFAAAVSIVGPPVDGIWAWPAPPTGGEASPANTRPQLENTRHVPIWITQGVEDELVPVSGVIHQANRLDELRHEYRLAIHPVGDHFAFVFQDNWSREVGWLASHESRVRDPHHVTFKVRTASWATAGRQDTPIILAHLADLTAEIGARLDGAYWVDDVAVAGAGDVTGFVDLTTGGIGPRQTGVDEVAAVGLDGPSPYILTGQDKLREQFAVDDTLSGTLSGVSSLTIDVGRAGLSNNPTVSVTSDIPATIIFVRDGAVVGQAEVG